MIHSSSRRSLVALALAYLAAGPAAAQTPPTPAYTWNAFGGGTWSAANNWVPAGPPPGGIDQVLGFGSSPLQTAGGYTSQFDTTFDLNSLVFSSSAGSITPVSLSGSTAASTLRFDTSSTGTLPAVWQVGFGGASIQNGTSTVGVTLNNGTTLRVLGDGIGQLQLDATIAQAGAGNSGLFINQPGTGPLNTGSVVRLGGANTFAGGVNLTAGNLRIANSAALGTGTFTVNGGTVQFDPAATASFTIANPVILNGTMVVTGAVANASAPTPTVTFSGPIGGPGGITFTNTAGGSVYAFTAANTFTGPVTLQPMGSTATTISFGTQTVSSGTAAGVPAFTLAYNSLLNLDNRAGVMARLNTVTPPTLTLNSSTLQLLGNAAANSSEAFGTLSVTGRGVIGIFGGSSSAQTTTLTFGGLSRPANGTLFILGTNLGSGTGAGESILRFTADPGGSVGGGGSPGTPTVNVLPYAVANSAATTAGGASLAPVLGLVRWDPSTKRVVPLNPATEYATNPFLAGNATPTANQRLASTATLPNAFGVAGLVGRATVNSLVLDTNVTAGNLVGVSLDGPGTLTVAGGAVLTGVNGSNSSLSTNPSTINLGGLSFGGNPGYVHTFTTLRVNSPISGSGGLIKSAGSTLILNGTNTFTGGLTVNDGLVRFTTDANLGAAGQPVALNGGINGGIQFQPDNLFGPATATATTVDRPVSVGPGGGNVTVTLANNNLTLAGTLSGTGQLNKAGSGVLTLTGTNTFTGNIVVGTGTLAFGSDAALGDPAATLTVTNGTLQPTASFTSNRTVLFTGGTLAGTPTNNTPVLFVNGVNWTVGGILTSQTASQTPMKDGTGDLVLTGVNTFTGNFQNGVVSPTVRGTATAAAPNAGRTILTGPNGSMPLAGQVLSIANGDIVLDNSAAVNNNRIGSVTVGLTGGNVTLLGNASAPVNEVIGQLSFANASSPYGGTLTLSTPAGSGQSTTLTVTGTPSISAASNVGTLFVRGTNLGAAAGDRTAVVLAANPAQVNGLIPSLVGATSATSEPTDFLTTQTVTVPAPNSNQFALVPFTAYTAGTGALGAGSAGATYDVTGAASFSGVSAANALRVRGGSVNLGGGMLSLTAGTVLATGGANGGIANGTLAFGSNVARVVVASGSDLTIGAALTGSGGFVKTGGGVLTLNAANPGLSNAVVVVGQGTLRYGASNALPGATTLFVNGGATFDLNGNAAALAVVQGYGNINLGAAALTLDSTAAPSVAFGGAFSGTGTLIKRNTNTITLAGSSPGFTGGVQVLGGTLAVNSDSALGTGTSPILLGDTTGTTRATLSLGTTVASFTRAITVQAGSAPATPHTLFAGPNILTASGNIALGQTLLLDTTAQPNAGSMLLSGTISGAGGLNVNSGSWAFSGNNTFSGGVTLNAVQSAAVGVGSDTAFGTGTLTFATLGGNLRADNGARTLANPVVIQSGGYFGVAGTNNLTLNGGVNLSGAFAAPTLNVMGTATTTLGGAISNGSAGINKIGPGVLVLTGSNTYSGTTTVNAGSLIVNNTAGSGTGVGDVVVNPGAIISGTGTVGDGGFRAVTVNSGAILRPGGSVNEIGTLHVNTTRSISFASGSVLQVNAGTNPTTGGRLNVTGGGTADLSGLSPAAPMRVYLTAAGDVTPNTLYSLTVIDSGSTPIAFPAGGFDASLFSVTADFPISGLSVLHPTPGTVVLTFTPVPEPGSVLLVVAGAAAAVVLRRRRRDIGRARRAFESGLPH